VNRAPPDPSKASSSDAESGRRARSGLRAAAIRGGWVVAVIAAVILPLVIRAGWEGRAELAQAEAAAARGDVDREIEHLGRAARWRVPGLSHHTRALERLVEIGEQAEATGPEAVMQSLAAYREVRSALLATRTWGVPRRAVFDTMNERIASLMAHQEAELGTDVSGTGDPYAHHLALLQQVPGPDPVRGNLAAFAFLGWLLSTGGFIVRGLDAKGRLRPRPALRWGGASLALLVAWIVLLRFA
jgi:hypothetical protein